MSYAYNHVIQPNKLCERPTHVIFYDVESDVDASASKIHRFTMKMWTAIYKRYRTDKSPDSPLYTKGTDTPTFWDFVHSHTYNKAKTYLVSHHLEVDFMPLKGMIELPKRGWSLNSLIFNGRTLAMYWVNGSRTLIVMNNGNLFDGSIEQWGKIFGYHKLPMPDPHDDDETWFTYCMRDTEIIMCMWNLLIDFLDAHNLGNFQITKASLAMSAFRHRFMTKKVVIHDHPEVLALERASYHGGRFEALKIGHFDNDVFTILDINSMYGWIEKTYDLPYELRGYHEQSTVEELRRRLLRYAVIAEVEVHLPIPLLPITVNHKVTYPTGQITTTMCSPELTYCLDHGFIRAVHKIAWYYKAPVLREFADFFLSLKDRYESENNQPMRQMCKLYLNSLYGKFAQHGYKDLVLGTCDPMKFEVVDGYDADTHERFTLLSYGGYIHKTIITEGGYNTFIALASHITAYGRMKMFELITRAGWNNVYHVATDSLLVNSCGKANLVTDIATGIPGMLKVETEGQSLVIKDVNDYVMDGVEKIKGIPHKAQKVSENTYIVETWPRLIPMLKNGHWDYYYTRTLSKTLSRPRYYQALGQPNPDINPTTKNKPILVYQNT